MSRKKAGARHFFTFILLAVICGLAIIAQAKVDPEAKPRHYNYREAGKQMRRIYYGELQETLYCGCRYLDKKTVDFSSCDFEPRHNPNRKSLKRAHSIEWEHIVTAHNMGHFLPCWKDGAARTAAPTIPHSRSWKGTFITSTRPSAK